MIDCIHRNDNSSSFKSDLFITMDLKANVISVYRGVIL